MGVIPLIPTLATGIGIPVLSAWLSGTDFKAHSREIAIGAVVGIAATGLAFMYATPAAPAAVTASMSRGIGRGNHQLPFIGELNGFPVQPNGWYTEGYPTTGNQPAYMSSSVIFVD